MRIFDLPLNVFIIVLEVYFTVFGMTWNNNMPMVATANQDGLMFYLPSSTTPLYGETVTGSVTGNYTNSTNVIFVNETELSSSRELISFLSSQNAQNHSYHVSFLSKEFTKRMWRYATREGKTHQQQNVLIVDQLSCTLVSDYRTFPFV